MKGKAFIRVPEDRMKKISPIALMAWLVFMSSSVGVLSAQPRLMIATNNYEPFYGESLPGKGPFLEVVQAAFAKAGYSTEIEFLPWARVIVSGETGKCDVVAGIWSNAGREKWMAISDPIMENEIGLFKRKSDPLRFSGFPDLGNQDIVVGTVAGYINPKGMEKAGIRTEEVPEDALNVQKLVNGRIRLALMDRQLGIYVAGRLNLLDRIEWMATLEYLPLRIGMIKTAEGDWQMKLADFNSALLAMKKDGTLAAILARHGFGSPPDARILPR